MAKAELERVSHAYRRWQRTEAERQKARGELLEAMRKARAAGASFPAIGRAAGGISRQRVAQILEE